MFSFLVYSFSILSEMERKENLLGVVLRKSGGLNFGNREYLASTSAVKSDCNPKLVEKSPVLFSKEMSGYLRKGYAAARNGLMKEQESR